MNDRMPRLLRVLIAASIYVAILVSLTATVGQDWIVAFARPVSPAAYLVFYFAMLVVFLLFFYYRMVQRPLLLQIVLGAVVGQLLGMTALFGASGFAFEDSLARTSTFVEREGILTFIYGSVIVYFFRAFMLGGWLIGAASLPSITAFLTIIRNFLNGSREQLES